MGNGTGDNGSEQEPTEPEQDNVDPDTLWGWFDSIVNLFNSLWESVKALPSQIGETILNILKEIFVPDAEAIQARFEETLHNITESIGMPLESLEILGENITEEAIPDEKGNYTIPGVGTFNFTFFDASFLKQGVEYFRPLLRGFIVLLLILYVYREVMAFIGINANVDGNGSGGIELSVIDRQTGKAPKMPKGGKGS